jgi:hypothetical protein
LFGTVASGGEFTFGKTSDTILLKALPPVLQLLQGKDISTCPALITQLRTSGFAQARGVKMSKKGYRACGLFLSVIVCLSGRPATAQSNQDERSFLSGAIGKQIASDLPLLFEENRGQVAPEVRYVARGANFVLLLTREEAVWALPKGPQTDPGTNAGHLPAFDFIRLRCLGANPDSLAVAEESAPTRTTYIRGSNPENWKAKISNFRKVRYKNIYPGIDWVFYGDRGKVEYDFVLSPGADPACIRLAFVGAQTIEQGNDRELVLRTDSGELRQLTPRIYQEINGRQQQIAGQYRLAEGSVTFELDDYDRRLPVTIDPVLVYSSYFGGTRGDLPGSIAVDSEGNLYVIGSTGSLDFPILNPVQDEFAGGGTPLGDVFVTKLNASGSQVVYSTYLGGGGTDIGLGISVDSEGRVIGAGTTFSTDFPSTPGSFQPTCSGLCPFVFKLSPDGSQLVYSTFVGRGSGAAVAVDAQSRAVLIGSTTSADFPVRNAFQPNRGGGSDAFVSKLEADGSSLVFSTFLGGSGDDNLTGKADIATDPAGRIYVTGRTRSADFPTSNPVQADFGGGDDAFVTKFEPNGTLIYSTFLGGDSDDQGWGIAADAGGNAHVTGTTKSANFPTRNALQPGFGGGTAIGDAFVAKIAPGGGSMVYSTYLGGQLGDIGADIAVDSLGQAVVVGNGASNFPVRHPLRTFEGIDNFVAKLVADGSELVYSTPIGGGDQDVAVATFGTDVYVAGNIATGTLPVLNAIQPRFSGEIDGFLTLLSDAGSLYFAQFGNGTGAVSDILLTNSSAASESAAALTFRGDDGTPVAMQVTVSDATESVVRDAPSGTLEVTVPPLGLVRVTTNGQGELVSGSVTVDFDSPLGGVIRFNLTPFGTAGVGESRLVRGFITPVRRSAINTGVAIFNPQDAQVGITPEAAR